MAGDGQVTFGETVLKSSARKIRTLYNDEILAGFAGAVADALTLFEKFEAELEQYHGNLRKAAVELTRSGVPINSCDGSKLSYWWRIKIKF